MISTTSCSKSVDIDLLAKALVDFQFHQPPIAPNATNSFLKNKYADLPALISGTKENLHKHGLAVSQILSGTGVCTILIHTSGQYIGDTMTIEPTEGKGTNAAQQMGVAITYTRRYAYASILGLVTDEDTDGATTKPEKKSEVKTQDKIEDEADAKLITEKQRKRLYAITKESAGTTEDAKTIMAKFGYGSSKEIEKSDYEEIVRQVETFKPVEKENDEWGNV